MIHSAEDSDDAHWTLVWYVWPRGRWQGQPDRDEYDHQDWHGERFGFAATNRGLPMESTAFLYTS